MIKEVLPLWLIISMLFGFLEIIWIEDWLRLKIKVKHIIVGILFLPMTIIILIAMFMVFIPDIFKLSINSKTSRRISNFLNKEILK